MRRSRLIPLLALLYVGTAASAPFQTCGMCARRSSPIYLYPEHAFGAKLGANMDCQAFNVCHINWQTGDCYDYHYACPLALAPGEMEAVFAAAAAGDAEALERVRARHPDAVVYDAGRRAVQLLGCRGEVVAQAPLRDSPAAAE